MPSLADLALRRFDEVGRFLEAADDFLVEREAEHNLLLGIAGNLRDRPEIHPEPPYFAAVTEGGSVVLVAMRTPPWSLVLSETALLDAVDLVVADLVAIGEPLPGVFGPPAVARRFVDGWTRRTRRRARLDMSERTYRLSHVLPRWRPVAGSWRAAETRDRGLLVEWVRAFEREALPDSAPSQGQEAIVDRWIARVGRWMGVWEVDGRVVSMVGAGSPTPNGVRIGPVYTPPAERRRGYASALTAAVSQAELDAGRRFCFLFTDLANSTSNRIYQEVGYEPVADVDQWAFE